MTRRLLPGQHPHRSEPTTPTPAPTPTLGDYQQRLRLVADQAEALAEKLPGPFATDPGVPDARVVAQQLSALQFVQTSTLGAADYANHIPLDPSATTAARLTAIALAGAHTRVTEATRHLAHLFQHSVSADVWAVPDAQPVDPRQIYAAARHQLGAAARELQTEADRLPSAGLSHLPAQARQPAAVSLPQRLRRALTRRSAEPTPLTALPRSAAKPRR
ncbi:hypothetical protein ABZX85_39490 [Streptomyces sp. NPDC004539]|uniref:hypothetical protein n=1 Tax=Streptomyces sp. NPDC004539 TaxID=3154280 RepID=UPI0033A85F32